jgi:hypothetical protein
MDLIKGTNLFHATRIRMEELREEWEVVRKLVCRGGLKDMEVEFSW